MKKSLYLLAITTFMMVSSCQKGPAEMKFTEKEFDFGQIKAGEKVDHTFKFTNSGANALLISDAKGSCGCTVPEYTKDSIMPGESGQIKVIFNSAGKKGKQEKSVTLTTNTKEGVEILVIKGEVIPQSGVVAPASIPTQTK